MVSLAFIVQAYGSILFHATPGAADWAGLLDAVGIQMVMTAIIGIAAHLTWDVSVSVVAPLVVLGWILWWTEVNHVRRNVTLGIELPIVVGLTAYTGSWGAAGTILTIALVAIAIWYFAETHTLLHAIWHVLSAVAQAASVVYFI